MPAITFQAQPYEIENRTIIRLPESASAKLSSRGMAMAQITVEDVQFVAPVEPDGKKGHWFEVGEKELRASGIVAGDTVEVELEPLNDWPRPVLPEDIQKGIAKVPEAAALWPQITPKAQWEWLRWIRATNNPDTRAKHIEVAASKMKSGMRRPCCFNSAMCTDFSVSKNGVLLEPAAATA